MGFLVKALSKIVGIAKKKKLHCEEREIFIAVVATTCMIGVKNNLEIP